MHDGDFGLHEGDLEAIRKVLADFPGIVSVKLFGSRAKGTYRNGSDVDLALYGNPAIGRNLVLEVSQVLNEETLLPYHFDVVDYASLESVALREHIDRIGIQIHPRQDQTQLP